MEQRRFIFFYFNGVLEGWRSDCFEINATINFQSFFFIQLLTIQLNQNNRSRLMLVSNIVHYVLPYLCFTVVYINFTYISLKYNVKRRAISYLYKGAKLTQGKRFYSIYITESSKCFLRDVWCRLF